MFHCVIDNVCSKSGTPFSWPPPCSAVFGASTHVVNGMMVCRPLSAVRGVGAMLAPVDLNNQITGISKNKGFLTPLRPLTLSFWGHWGLNLNPSIPEHLACSHFRITPTASSLPQDLRPCRLNSADVDCWDNTSHWTAIALSFLSRALLIFAVVFECQQRSFVNAKMLKTNAKNPPTVK